MHSRATAKERVAIVGGGATGAALAWALARTGEPRRVVLFHDENELGGHSRTIPVRFDARGRGEVCAASGDPESYPVDIGVQFVCPSLYPNLYQQLQLPELRHVKLVRHPALKMSGAFGDDLLWGNFADYQSGERFAKCFDAATRAHAETFQRGLRTAPWTRIGGEAVLEMTVGRYLDAARIPRGSHFFRYLLIPYLCVINGYGTVDLLETTMTDLFPIFTRVPLLQDDGPYGSFTVPGLGWDRFERGSTEWVLGMAAVGEREGVEVRCSSPVTSIVRRGGEWLVGSAEGATWGEGGRENDRAVEARTEAFDVVVMTTDMTTNRELLAHDRNPYWSRQRDFLSGERFRLLPGVCYIHQDPDVLAPDLRDEREDGQFTGSFAWGRRDEGSELYDLPYDLGAAYQTYLMHNVLGTPARCYVSMYAEDRTAVVPDPALTLFRRTWRHGRWVASFFRDAKRELHRVQGLGGIWFAGNNTTVDSEEGALVSAMAIASRISGFEYPFARLSSAAMLYRYFAGIMFPPRTIREHVRALAIA